ncbi:hypothetical protein TSUD_381820 [Trifolium subterraneum]|uniref:F-box domain-containing protein n=1 Tax=Trifolium subterraneum TaxID=3900 RepID=A0A2Z6M5C6_TRISU|nr:hypothetical protein TSUD_381820 [Trifolium subterraneum]
MAPSSENDVDGNDAVSSNLPTEETTVTNLQRLNLSTTETLTSPSPSSSSAIPGDPLHSPPLPTLPIEIIAEILSRLPIKFLIQLQSVCKPWKSLISDPKFAKKHFRLSTTRHHLVLTHTNPSREYVLTDYLLSSVFTAAIQLDCLLPFREHIIASVGSCHGIICFVLDQNYQNLALLWNPSIRKFMKLPSSFDNPTQEVGLCYTNFGFGYVYDHFNDNYSYKVVAVNHYDEYDSDVIDGSDFHVITRTQVKVYTLGTSSWRIIQDCPYGILYGDSVTFVSGTVNWWVTNDSNISEVIVSLDLDKESYQEIMQPNYGVGIEVTRTLGVLRDCLSTVARSDTFSDVWLMKEYGNKESWTKLFRIPHSCIEDLEFLNYLNPLYLSEDDQVLLDCRYEGRTCHDELAIYNSRDNTFKTTEIQNINFSTIHGIYQESLLSPCSL